MNFLNFFTSPTEAKRYSQLFDEIKSAFPQESEETIVKTSCIAGLLAQVAYADFSLDITEAEKITQALTSLNPSGSLCPQIVTEISTRHIKVIAGLENHLYIQPLRTLLTQDEKFELIKFLFAIAASDGDVTGDEVEDIRSISRGLNLTGAHFLAARAEYKDYLRAMRG